MNRKAIVINVIILALLGGFVVMSMVTYYLIPIGQNIINFLEEVVTDLISIIWR